MRKPVLIAAFVLAGAALALAVLFFTFDPDSLRAPLQAQLEARLQRKVTIGRMEMRFLPPAIALQELVIRQPAGFPDAKPMVAARGVRVQVALWPLLRREVELQRVELDTPAVELIRSPAGKWNYETDGGSAGQPLTLDRLAIRDGTLGVTRDGRRQQFEHITVTLRGGFGGVPGSLEAKVRLDAARSEVAVRADFAPAGSGTTAKGNVEVRSERLKETLTAEFEGTYSGGGFEVRSLRAKLGALAAAATGRVSEQALDLRIQSAQAPLGDLLRVAGLFGASLPAGLQAEGAVDIDVAVTGAPAAPAVRGAIAASDARIAGKDLREPVRASALRIEFTPDVLTTNAFRVETGRTQLTAQARVSAYQTANPQAELTLRTSGASLEELLRIAAAYGFRPEGMSGKGEISLDATLRRAGRQWTYSGAGSLQDVELKLAALPEPLGVRKARAKFAGERVTLEDVEASLGASHLTGSVTLTGFDKPNLEFRAAMDNFDAAAIRQWRTEHPSAAGGIGLGDLTARGTVTLGKLSLDRIVLTDVKATAALSRGILTLDPVSSACFGGQLGGVLTADLNQTPARYAIRAKLASVETQKLLGAMSSLRGLSGPLSGDADLQFSAADAAQLAPSLNGKVRLSMPRGRLEGVNVLNEVASIARFLGYAPREAAYTEILKLDGTFDIVAGLARTQDLRAAFDGGSLGAAGAIGLADQKLNLRATAILTREFLQKSGGGSLGGDRVGGWLTTALGNQNGELVVPAIVSGNFGAPRFAPDAEQVAKLKLQSVLPASTKGILDAITGKPPAEGAKPEGGLGDLLDRFRKKKEKKP